ncbi:MAG: hypothetical protein QF681_08960 [Vicinamibacterales bacterium]|nr:hypothetical protein [Vicinamibacterales bacterium]
MPSRPSSATAVTVAVLSPPELYAWLVLAPEVLAEVPSPNAHSYRTIATVVGVTAAAKATGVFTVGVVVELVRVTFNGLWATTVMTIDTETSCPLLSMAVATTVYLPAAV